LQITFCNPRFVYSASVITPWLRGFND
jgi:hypothetical protein